MIAIIVIGAVNIIGIISDLVPNYTVVQHWVLSTDRDLIAVGMLLSFDSCSEIIY